VRLILARSVLLLVFGSAFCLTIRLAIAELEFRLDPQAALRSPNWINAAHLAGFESSKDELRAAVTLDPRLSSAWIHLGLDAEEDGNLREAETDLLRAASVDHLYVPAWTLVNFYFRRDDEPKFWPWAKRAAELTSDDYRPLLRLADALDTAPHHVATSVATSVATRLGGGAPLLRAYLDILINADRLDSAREIADELAARHDPVDHDRLAAFAERLK
jgi:tetratricopeptide (TPR) repeat protein